MRVDFAMHAVDPSMASLLMIFVRIAAW